MSGGPWCCCLILATPDARLLQLASLACVAEMQVCVELGGDGVLCKVRCVMLQVNWDKWSHSATPTCTPLPMHPLRGPSDLTQAANKAAKAAPLLIRSAWLCILLMLQEVIGPLVGTHRQMMKSNLTVWSGSDATAAVLDRSPRERLSLGMARVRQIIESLHFYIDAVWAMRRGTQRWVAL